MKAIRKISKEKKAAMLLYLATIALVIAAFAFLTIKVSEKPAKFEPKYIGEHQIALLKTAVNAEKFLLFVDQAAKPSAMQSVYNLGQKGGYPAGSGCGNYLGYESWRASVKEGEETKIKNCFPDEKTVKYDLAAALNNELYRYLNVYWGKPALAAAQPPGTVAQKEIMTTVSGASFTFVVLSDVHEGQEYDTDRLVESIKGHKPDYIIINGDLIMKGGVKCGRTKGDTTPDIKCYNEFYDKFKSTGATVLSITGNHDKGDHDAIFGKKKISFEEFKGFSGGNIALIGLDYRYFEGSSPEKLPELSDINPDKFNYAFIFSHEAFIGSKYYKNGFSTTNLPNDFVDQLKTFNGNCALFAGDNHVYDVRTGHESGCLAVIDGVAGGDHYCGKEWCRKDSAGTYQDYSSYTLVEVFQKGFKVCKISNKDDKKAQEDDFKIKESDCKTFTGGAEGKEANLGDMQKNAQQNPANDKAADKITTKAIADITAAQVMGSGILGIPLPMGLLGKMPLDNYEIALEQGDKLKIYAVAKENAEFDIILGEIKKKTAVEKAAEVIETGVRNVVNIEGCEIDIPKTESHSVGSPNSGTLENGFEIPFDGQYHMVNPVARPRNRNYATNELYIDLQKIGCSVNKAYGTKIIFNDVSKEGGGNIGHLSHRSGRDVDLGFICMKDGKRYPCYKDVTLGDGVVSDFDPEANWLLVKSMFSIVKVRFVFLNRHIIDAIVGWAEANDPDKETVEKIKKQLYGHQMSNHVTHYHMRIECPEGDTRCVTGP